MAGIYPELWLNRVDNKLRAGDSAPWLNGIPEIATPVIASDAGSLSEKNTIHVPVSDFEVDILVNNTDYPIAVQEYEDDTIDINLTKYQTKQVPISDDQATGSSYAQIDNVTYLMVQSLNISKYSRAIYNIGPAANTANTPLLKTTGRSGKFNAEGDEIILKAADGRLLLVYKDLVDHKAQYDALEVPEMNRRLVLSSEHYNDLLLDTTRIGDLIRNLNSGTVATNIAGFDIYTYLLNPYYDVTTAGAFGAKLAFGAVPEGFQYKASISFYTPNLGVKTGFTRQYYSPASINPATQSNTLAYRHYHICTPKRTQYIGAIVSQNNG